jgi:hypothetical protein
MGGAMRHVTVKGELSRLNPLFALFSGAFFVAKSRFYGVVIVDFARSISDLLLNKNQMLKL